MSYPCFLLKTELHDPHHFKSPLFSYSSVFPQHLSVPFTGLQQHFWLLRCLCTVRKPEIIWLIPASWFPEVFHTHIQDYFDAFLILKMS